MPKYNDATIIDKPYKLSVSGRKNIRLKNGWVVFATQDYRHTNTVDYFIRIYVTKDNFATPPIELCNFKSANYAFKGFNITEISENHICLLTSTLGLKANVINVLTQVNEDISTKATVLEHTSYQSSEVDAVMDFERGILHVAHSGRDNNIYNTLNIRYWKANLNLDNTLSWSSRQLVTSSSATSWSGWDNPAIVINALGQPVIFTDLEDSSNAIYSLNIARFNINPNGTWSQNIFNKNASWVDSEVNPAAIFVPPSITNTPNGRIWLAWAAKNNTTSTHNLIVTYSDDGGTNFTEMKEITKVGDPNYEVGISMTANTKNEVFIVFTAKDPNGVGTNDTGIFTIKHLADNIWDQPIMVKSSVAKNPSAIYDFKRPDFTTPIFSYEDMTGNKIGFIGDALPSPNVNVTPGDLGFKNNSGNILDLIFSLPENPIKRVIVKVNGNIINNQSI